MLLVKRNQNLGFKTSAHYDKTWYKHDVANHHIYNMKLWNCQSLMTQMIFMISTVVRQPLKSLFNLWSNRRGLLLLRSQKPVPKRFQRKNILGALPKMTSLHPIQLGKNVVGVSSQKLLNLTKQHWSNSFLRHLVDNFVSIVSLCLYIELYIVKISHETSIGDQMISRYLIAVMGFALLGQQEDATRNGRATFLQIQACFIGWFFSDSTP